MFPYSSQVFGPIFTKLGERVECAPRYVIKGLIFLKVKVIEVKGQKGQICFFPYYSQVFAPIFTKFGGKVEGDPWVVLEGLIF